MAEKIVLGDEAVALGAIDAGISSAYGYPGTPSTEIMEYLQDYEEKNGSPFSRWCSNEKTAYEDGLGTSFAGCRVLVTMKHVGLNVAADPFVNSALLNIKGGFVLVVADDPGMHSSQNEQDSRYFADFAKIICLEPTSQQEAYDMTREAFDLSEKYHIPVMLRLTTRLSHSRAVINTREARAKNKVEKAQDKQNWMLVPALARKRWHHLLGLQEELNSYCETTDYNKLVLRDSDTAVITTGLGKNYFLENEEDMAEKPSVLHIRAYPLPVEKIKKIAEKAKKIIVLEEGYPLLESRLRGILPQSVEIAGKIDGTVPPEGELTPDNVRPALGLSPKESIKAPDISLANRPPQLCKGCPHGDAYNAIKEALNGLGESVVSSDIGCYALGVLPPYSVPETIICMGASIGTAKGAAEAGHPNCVGVIGDSTFMHSGVPSLVDAVSHNTNMTLVILDNSTTAMTGGQDTIISSSAIVKVVHGLGVDPDHIKVVEAHKKDHEENVKIIRSEIQYKGLSVVIAVRECLETLRKKKKAQKTGNN